MAFSVRVVWPWTGQPQRRGSPTRPVDGGPPGLGRFRARDATSQRMALTSRGALHSATIAQLPTRAVIHWGAVLRMPLDLSAPSTKWATLCIVELRDSNPDLLECETRPRYQLRHSPGDPAPDGSASRLYHRQEEAFLQSVAVVRVRVRQQPVRIRARSVGGDGACTDAVG